MATEFPRVVVRRTFFQLDCDTEARVQARLRAFTDSLLDPPVECLSCGSRHEDACKDHGYALSDEETISGHSMQCWSSEADESEGCDDFVLDCQELSPNTPAASTARRAGPPGQFQAMAPVSHMSGYFSPLMQFVSSPALSPVVQAPSPLPPMSCVDASPREQPLLPSPLKEQSSQSPAGRDKTTVMLRNLPNDYNREMFLQLLDCEGFAGRYDFVYLPMDFQTYACRGYAFVNLVDTEAAAHFLSAFESYSNWAVPSRKVSGVSFAGPLQGLEAHIKKYRNASVMGPATPDAFRPVLFKSGVRQPFPAPSKKFRGC